MLLELMSNGNLAKLPSEYVPDGVKLPDEPAVMVLLPHNKYLLGTFDKWIYSDLNAANHAQEVFLYDDTKLALANQDTRPIIISAQTVNELRKELFMICEPPGQHTATVMLLKTFLKYHPAFVNENIDYLDENIFALEMQKDSRLYKAYWTLRFALSRSELEEVTRIKAWLRAGPENFDKSEHEAKIYFSLTDLPDKESLKELEENYSFTKMELQKISAQNISPVVVYNPKSGWLIHGRFGRKSSSSNLNLSEAIFFVWVYLNHELWNVLREVRKMPVNEIVNAICGYYDTLEAVAERDKYKQ